jgi:hypothetical protein
VSSATIIEATVQSEERLFFEVGSHTFIVTSGYAAFEGFNAVGDENEDVLALHEAHRHRPLAAESNTFRRSHHLRIEPPGLGRG